MGHSMLLSVPSITKYNSLNLNLFLILSINGEKIENEY